ncbi:DMT family transporter [Actinocrispum wychmicini]|uniref:Magnesium transporter NIPA n=1 Tax=Actinocrispum wychmicini TaxID=1213861 RepID=A0A4R2K2K0_9PSEU|nr:DMT family transporter [Actinocrispum wychmicini]TCO60535.1 magnesium transporter NIPA [Actinocrispum wychmicini]
MTETGAMLVAVCCAIAGAASFGLAGVAQQRAAKEVRTGRTLHPGLLLRLVRKPMWLVGLVSLGVGFVSQAIALAFGPLALVQPLGVTSALFGAGFAAWMTRRRVDRTVALGAFACVGGLSVFLLVAQPSGQVTEFDVRDAAPLALVFGPVVVAAVLAATRFTGEVRALALALAAGVCYGVTAGLLKAVAVQIRFGGVGEPFQHWALLVACVTGPPGFLLSQNAFQQGRQVAVALAVITTVDPLVAVVVGVGWLGETVAATPAALIGEAFGAVAVVVGVAVLTRRGNVVTGGGRG